MGMCDPCISGHSSLPSLFVETVSWSSGWPPTYYVAENALELAILLPLTESAESPGMHHRLRRCLQLDLGILHV